MRRRNELPKLRLGGPAGQPPGNGPGERSKNPWYADWFEAGLAMCGEHLARLKAMIEAEGFASPDVLFLTNDSPFALQLDDLTLRRVLLDDGPTKNAVALAAPDCRPGHVVTLAPDGTQEWQATPPWGLELMESEN